MTIYDDFEDKHGGSYDWDVPLFNSFVAKQYIDDFNATYPEFVKYQDKTLTKMENTVVQTKEELLRQRELLTAQLSALDTKIESREVYGPDPFKNGDYLKIMATFKSSPGSYTYACVKVRGKFYLTGRVQLTRTFLGEDDTPIKNGWTYDQLVSWFATTDDVQVWRVTKLEKVL